MDGQKHRDSKHLFFHSMSEKGTLIATMMLSLNNQKPFRLFILTVRAMGYVQGGKNFVEVFVIVIGGLVGSMRRRRRKLLLLMEPADVVDRGWWTASVFFRRQGRKGRRLNSRMVPKPLSPKLTSNAIWRGNRKEKRMGVRLFIHFV